MTVTIRMPAELHDQLNALAHQGDRSLNQQIVRLLRQAVASQPEDD